jgi:thiol:disulfide interchange protein DsbC
MNQSLKISLLLTLSTSLYSMSTTDKNIIEYQTQVIKHNPAYDLHSLKLEKKEPLDTNGAWNAYKLQLDITQKSDNKRFKAPMIVFSNGKYITNDLIDMTTGQRYGEAEQRAIAEDKRKAFEKSFTLPNSYYKKDRLIAGNHNAKNKVVVFSDPLCVYCIQSVPTIIKGIKNRKDVALYYYDFPLDMHPTAKTVIQAMIKAKEDGIKDVELQVYEANYENFYNVYREKDPKAAIDAFNEIFDTEYTVQSVNTKSINKHMQEDIISGIEANVQGTPSVNFNGSFLNSREKLNSFLNNK